MPLPAITVDTNCINARSSLSAMNHLERLHSEGRITLVKTDVMDTELSTWDGGRGSRARQKSAHLQEDVGVLVLDHSRLDHARLAEDGDADMLDRVAVALFRHPLKKLHRRQVRDVMMVSTHLKHGRDVLVTKDRDLLDSAVALAEQFGVIVLTPGECLALVGGRLSTSRR